MTHTHGADNNAVHLFAYRTFFRQVWVAEVLGYKWYGLGQDLVGKALGRQEDRGAGRPDAAVPAACLPSILPPAGAAAVRRAAGTPSSAGGPARRGTGAGAAVRRQRLRAGPRLRRAADAAASPVGLLAIDKAGPSAFNLPVWEACAAAGPTAA